MKLKQLIFLNALICVSVFAQSGSISDSLYQKIVRESLEKGIAWYQELPKENQLSESELNALGYRLMGEEYYRAAISLFQINVERHPKSPNVYDSIGEAYIQTGEFGKAIVQYQKALEVLSQAILPQQAKKFLKNNAEGKLKYLKNPENRKEFQLIEQFIPQDGESKYGKLHPDAPIETASWGRLVGNWHCTQSILLPSGQWVFAGKATWIWKYILDGFGIQDLWIQKFIDLPPTLVALGRDVAGTNIRVYDAASGKWNVVWFTNNNNTMSQFDAFIEGDAIVMKSNSGAQLRQITFHSITDTSFQWKREISDDNGATWKETFRITGKRVE